MLQIKKINRQIVSKYLYFKLVKGEGYFYFITNTPEEIGTSGVDHCENYHAKVKAFAMLDTTSVMTHKLNDLTLEQWMEEAETLHQRVLEEMDFKLVHETTRRHYEEYATITGGTAKPVLKKIVMDMIGGDLKALRKAYDEDKHLNNIDKVLRKAGTLKTFGNFQNRFEDVTVEHITGKKKLSRTNYGKARSNFESDFKSRCTMLGISSQYVKMINGPYCNDWFLSFDYYLPEFISATQETRKKWKEVSGGYHAGGVSNSTICSGLKHIMIFDILECEFVEEKRS